MWSRATARDDRSAPTHDDIAALAYAKYLARRHDHGNAVRDWLDAERELRRGSPPRAAGRA
jgi:hypothetical protein